MKHIFKNNITLIAIAIVSLSSCKSFLKIDPPKDKFDIQEVVINDETATSAITGIYSKMAFTGFASGDIGSLSNLAGLSADELQSHSSTLNFFFQNDIQTNDSRVNSMWTTIYNSIYVANAIIEELPGATHISPSIKEQLLGEAKFIRAFHYFYLINLFGDVPLILNSDYRLNQHIARSSKSKVFMQIIDDLLAAETLVSSKYITTERVRPNKWVVKAFLSRVYLYAEKWADAAAVATEVIDQKDMYELVSDLDNVFLKNSKEAIWQLMPQAGYNTNEGGLFILTGTPRNVSLSPDLLAAFNDPEDNRKTKWIKRFANTTGEYSYPFKYKVRTSVGTTLPITEYSMVIRLAEIYLIRAEARIRSKELNLALEDINVVRKRAGMLIPKADLTEAQALSELEKQRRLELFSEWGHRWLDLKRTGRADLVLAPLKGSAWNNSDVLYLIPDNEVNRNNNILQNPGY